MLQKGYSAKKTAYELGLSKRTVETYLNNLKQKFDCETKYQLLGMLIK